MRRRLIAYQLLSLLFAHVGCFATIAWPQTCETSLNCTSSPTAGITRSHGSRLSRLRTRAAYATKGGQYQKRRARVRWTHGVGAFQFLSTPRCPCQTYQCAVGPLVTFA